MSHDRKFHRTLTTAILCGPLAVASLGCGKSANSSAPVQQTPEEKQQMDDYYKKMQQQHPPGGRR